MQISRLINEVYYDQMINQLYEFRTTDAHFHVNDTTSIIDIASILTTCYGARVNFFMCDKSTLENRLSSQQALQEFEREVIFTMHHQYSKRRAIKINEEQGPTKVDLRINDTLEEKLKYLGLPNYMNDRNLDKLFNQFAFLMS